MRLLSAFKCELGFKYVLCVSHCVLTYTRPPSWDMTKVGKEKKKVGIHKCEK